ncbi:DNA cytosine methyltransferase [Micromonospora chersina]|uniref:DNA cytosine methyltransferase n=1 Tax=Micromonospora chersina TaxID=47854 RepID=UPI0037139B39
MRVGRGVVRAAELVLGGRLTWYAETARHARIVLAHHWPHVPNLGDIRTVDWSRVPPVDVLTAGFPCLNDTLDGPSSGGAHAVAG